MIKPEVTLLSSKRVSKFMHMPYIEEPSPESITRSIDKSMYIGKTALSSIPYFLSPNELINPHIFAFGITGSGKSYLLKSLAVKLYLFGETRSLIIDFTGEYKEFVEFLDEKETNTKLLDTQLSDKNRKILYFNLFKLEEKKKVKTANEILLTVLGYMRTLPVDSKIKLFVMLDEAWKLLSENKTVEILIREGRKYGVGIILSSQVLTDIDAKFLSNIATIFVFRIQDSESLEKLSSSYSLTTDKISLIQNLEVGTCLLIQLYKDHKIGSFTISKVSGIDLTKNLFMGLGDSLQIEISENEFEKFLKNVGINGSGISEIRSIQQQSESFKLQSLISRLLELGANRRSVLKGLRKLGVSDSEIADGFAMAVAETGSLHV